MSWSGEHREFVIEEFINYGGSPITIQRAFRIRFALNRRDPVPDSTTIRNWVSNFRQTSSALKRKSTGRPRTATGPENVATVTVTSNHYCEMLKHFLRPKLNDFIHEYGQRNVSFQQDGTTAHTTRRSLGILREMFPGHIVSL
ncbi:Protein of unknown function DUF4817 [Cinara cedri]|uniref:DUF4817 domain-containing protein n=1 Tax=Cinara cedri TaxID=506608 RepID=A0A5E4MJA8_9HEMI|nr:Protein of unknown function DUF4817 [Cinara cedri]